jgi:hypothetical protein
MHFIQLLKWGGYVNNSFPKKNPPQPQSEKEVVIITFLCNCFILDIAIKNIFIDHC